MFIGLLQPSKVEQQEQLLKLYWNRAEVKRELRDLRRERYELLDKLKDHGAAIERAREQLEGLERLLTNPLAAANAMVYFQLRHLWRVSALRVEQFGAELELQRRNRERRQLHEAELAKRKRRLDAIHDKLADLDDKRFGLVEEAQRLEQRLKQWNFVLRLLRGPRVHRRLAGLARGRRMLDERVDELKDLVGKIRGEGLPEPDGLSTDSRRLINTAMIALAQHLAVHFSEANIAGFAKQATGHAVGDMKFGNRRDCDRMVELIRERLQDLKRQKLPDLIRRRAEALMPNLRYRNETDAVPLAESISSIDVRIPTDPARRIGDAPIRINVLADDYWDLGKSMRR
ncbi:MAG TPA: hypothetical protein VFY39_02870 [Gammaproteobacteria bacterium]|nr:hypothetical protein [Gammaproteobacteria bacterium]